MDVIPDVLSLHTFGFSLASGIDVDGNLFNGNCRMCNVHQVC